MSCNRCVSGCTHGIIVSQLGTPDAEHKAEGHSLTLTRGNVIVHYRIMKGKFVQSTHPIPTVLHSLL